MKTVAECSAERVIVELVEFPTVGGIVSKLMPVEPNMANSPEKITALDIAFPLPEDELVTEAGAVVGCVGLFGFIFDEKINATTAIPVPTRLTIPVNRAIRVSLEFVSLGIRICPSVSCGTYGIASRAGSLCFWRGLLKCKEPCAYGSQGNGAQKNIS